MRSFLRLSFHENCNSQTRGTEGIDHLQLSPLNNGTGELIGATALLWVRIERTLSDDQSASDEAILGEISSMCDLLGLRRLVPEKLVWQDRIYIGRNSSYPMPVDMVVAGRKKVILSTRMQGVLTPEEWKPLIGSSLLSASWARPRALKVFLGSTGLTLGIYISIFLLATMTSLLGSTGGLLETFLPIYFSVWVVLLILFAFLYAPSAHRALLRADSQVASRLGSGAVIATLKKIESQGFEDVEKRDVKTSKIKQPSVRERIQNLESSRITPPQ